MIPSRENYRLDAAEIAFFERQLEQVAAKSYDVKYPQLKGRQFVPINNRVDRGAETYKYNQYDMAGVAKVLASYADDYDMADIKGKEFRVAVKPIASGFRYNIQELYNARFAGLPLEQRKANAARFSIEQRLDIVLFSGDTDTGLKGLLNLANTLVYVVPNNAGNTSPLWSKKTPLEILADLNGVANLIVSTTNEVEVPDTLILPIEKRQMIAETPMFSVGGSNVTIEKFFLDNSPYIKRIEQSYRLKGAGANGVDRMVAYRRDPDALEGIVTLEPEFLPPQPQDFGFKIPAHARTAGVVAYYPMSLCYADGI